MVLRLLIFFIFEKNENKNKNLFKRTSKDTGLVSNIKQLKTPGYLLVTMVTMVSMNNMSLYNSTLLHKNIG